MSFGICSSCKNADSCTYPRSRDISQCEEYASVEPRPTRRKQAITSAGQVARIDMPAQAPPTPSAAG